MHEKLRRVENRLKDDLHIHQGREQLDFSLVGNFSFKPIFSKKKKDLGKFSISKINKIIIQDFFSFRMSNNFFLYIDTSPILSS